MNISMKGLIVLCDMKVKEILKNLSIVVFFQLTGVLIKELIEMNSI